VIYFYDNGNEIKKVAMCRTCGPNGGAKKCIKNFGKEISWKMTA